MTAARLVATVPAPLAPANADAPEVVHRMLVQRGDTELVALDPGSRREVRFPAPWPRRFGTATVSPRGDFAVFAGLHAVRAVDPAGSTRWEVRHACWRACDAMHASPAEYADAGHHPARHWLLHDLTLRGEITYPFPVTGPPRPAGEGTWYTLAEDGTAVRFWTLSR
ncbi:hypothetical protein GCM10017786_64100 [Amycolatopsis deserti]|uniref:Uncharacterized protein n=1 Tax=Amycolatopsis deserti TaxID=185696 RepID=A0ABQ3JDB6_9PSEU|nr:hypothetical protein [Amycolatopsis deserti]GHF21322.1 hypothetical protein GCM10017786_64100 [Amycolatopsis deserti]